MKRFLIVVIALATVFTLAACSSASPAAHASETPAQPSPLPKEDCVKIDGNTISVKDDGTGESSDKDGMKKDVVLTTRNIGYNGECGPFKYEVQSVQVAKITATSDDVASFLSMEKGHEATLIGIQIAVENTSDEDMTWYPYMSTITTSDKEQVESDWLISDSVGGEFMGNVVKKGQIYFLCKETNADTLTHIKWRIDTPHDKNLNHLGEEVVIEFDFPKA